MSRILPIALGQLGPIARSTPRQQVVQRLCELMREAHARGAHLIVYPELALTTFFPRWYMEDEEEINSFFEQKMPSTATQPLFDLARELQIGFYLGYAERTHEHGREIRYNTAILVGRDGNIIGKYHKVHLPGHADYQPWRAFQHLEKRYFTPGQGFDVHDAFGGRIGMALCNDRRWAETYRVMGLQGVEMVLIGYNTPVHNAPAPEHDHLSLFHNELSMQAGAYQNGTWVVGVAKGGKEEGIDSIAGSCVIAPSGEVVARCLTQGDEVAIAHCDLDFCKIYQRTTFNFDMHRQPHAYGLIVERKGTTLAADGSPLTA